MIQDIKETGTQLTTKSGTTGDRTHCSTPPLLPVVEGEDASAQPSLLPPAHPSWPQEALRTGVSVGADQAVSSHLRGWLVTTVQELLRAEHVAGVGNPVHAVQDIDLRREGLVSIRAPPQVQLLLSRAIF